MRYAIHTLLARTTHAQQNYLRPYLKQLGLSPGQPHPGPVRRPA